MTPTNELQVLIDEYLENYDPIPPVRNYWLIRTEGGSYYQSFVENSFVAIGYNNISHADINRVGIQHGKKFEDSREALKKLAHEKYPKEERPGLIGNQIGRFTFELKKDDVVIIPSYNSDYISFGIVQSDEIYFVDKEQIVKTGCAFTKRKKVKWEKEVPKNDLDIYLYKALHAHQAINNITHYSQIIERTLGNFYIVDTEGNLVLDVATNDEIKAIDLFSLGYNLLHYAKGYFEYHNLDISIDDIDIKINLNSPGKIHLTSTQKTAILVLAILTLGTAGGGLTTDWGGIELNTNGIIKSIDEYQQNAHDRKMQEKIIDSMDSLNVLPPTDVLDLLKTFDSRSDSTN